MKTILCPVCNYPLDEPAEDFNYCPCCGTQFGYHDVGHTYQQLREGWIQRGMQWWSPVRKPPEHWDPKAQLLVNTSAD